MDPIKVLVVEDQPVARAGLRILLASSGDVTAVAEADSAEAAIRALASCTAHVVLLDLDLGGEDGVNVASRMVEAAPGTKVLAVTALRDAARQRAALLAGARGVVTKDKPGELILGAIRKVASGEMWFEHKVLEATLSRSISRSGEGEQRHEELTDREREIVSLIGEGLRNAEIAVRLCISEKTVRNHLTSIFGKLGVSDRLELLIHACQSGMVNITRGAAV